MEFSLILKTLLSLVFVISMIYGLSLLLKRTLDKGMLRSKSSIKIKDVQFIDPKRKVVKVEHNNKTYLVLLGSSEILLDSYEHYIFISSNTMCFLYILCGCCICAIFEN